jgi:hypothetical protein
VGLNLVDTVTLRIVRAVARKLNERCAEGSKGYTQIHVYPRGTLSFISLLVHLLLKKYPIQKRFINHKIGQKENLKEDFKYKTLTNKKSMKKFCARVEIRGAISKFNL